MEKRGARLVIAGISVQEIWESPIRVGQRRWCGDGLEQGIEFCALLRVHETGRRRHFLLEQLIRREGNISVSRD